MLLSIGAYALLWGWQFAVGFVILLFVHELDTLEAKRQGLPVTAPLFIPFLGAMIMLKENPQDAWREAKMAIAGPILGSLGAVVTGHRRGARLRPAGRASRSPASSSTCSTC